MSLLSNIGKWTVLLCLLFGIASPTYAQSSIDNKTIQENAKEAYIFTFPLVMNYRTMYAQAIENGSFGQWLHLDLSSPKDTDIVTPNNDTPYSYAWVDVRSEPWVLTTPKIEDERFYTSQWDDLWGYVLDNAGSVIDGNSGYSYLLASPSWKGETPKGIKRVIRGESDFLGTLTRTQVLGGKEDIKRVKEIQSQYKLQPLSEFLGQKAPAAAIPITWPKWTEGDETSVKFFEYASFLLKFTSPHDEDKAMYKKLSSLGIEADKQWEAKNVDPETLKAIEAGIADARKELEQRSEQSFDPALFFNNRETMSTDYLNRALGVYVGIFGNTTQQSVYFTEVRDINGDLTDGSKHDYTVTFEPGQLPPIKYFWSYTMYRLPERWLVDNPIDRYSIGSSTPGLKENEDGSVTIYVSKKSPGKDKESNWLPAPNGPFWMVLRTYGPKDNIRDSWKQPPFVPVTE
jgi:hypothetical protein